MGASGGYRINGKEKRISLGVYPEVGQKDAREKCDAARKQVADGIDPTVQRKAAKLAGSEKSANSFEVVARDWFGKFSKGWAPSHGDKIIRRLERDIFPWIGSRPIAEVTAPELLAVLRRVENRGALETAHRAKQNCGQIFRYAIATGRAERDPSADLRGALPRLRKHTTPPLPIRKKLAACYARSTAIPAASSPSALCD